jgi:hypothetical protein
MEVVYTGECLCTNYECTVCQPPPPLPGGGGMAFAAGKPVVAADGTQLAAAYDGVRRPCGSDCWICGVTCGALPQSGPLPSAPAPCRAGRAPQPLHREPRPSRAAAAPPRRRRWAPRMHRQ